MRARHQHFDRGGLAARTVLGGWLRTDESVLYAVNSPTKRTLGMHIGGSRTARDHDQ